MSLATALEAKDQYTQRPLRARGRLRGGAGGRRRALAAASGANLRRAGLLHDIGKIGIRARVPEQARPSSPTEEYEEVKQHPVIGFEICKPLRTMAPLLDLIRGHHERLDGRGYPDGLAAEQIPVPLRCLTIADVYDALTSDRAYRKAMARDEGPRDHAAGGERRHVGHAASSTPSPPSC